MKLERPIKSEREIAFFFTVFAWIRHHYACRKKNSSNITVKSGSKDHGLITPKLVIRPPVFFNSNFFATDILSLPYYIQRFIKQKIQFAVKKKLLGKKGWSYNPFFVIRPWSFEPDFTVSENKTVEPATESPAAKKIFCD